MAAKDPVEYRLYDTDLTTVLGILPGIDMSLYLQLNEPGSGQVKIPLNSRAADVITSDQFIEVRYRGAVRGGFFVENIGKDQANAGEKGGQWLTLSGRGAMMLLDDAVVWDDGTGSSTRSFTGTRAGIIVQLIQEAQNRDAFSNLDYDFTDTLDSDGEAWDDDEPLSIPVGKSILDVVRDISKTGIDFEVLPDGSGGFVLSAYKNGIGTDKSSNVYFRIGQNCQEVSHQEAGGDIRNAIKVKYKNGFTTVIDATSITARRRREGFLDVRFAGDLAAAQTFGSAELALKKDPNKEISVNVHDGTGPRAFVNYQMGDYIMLDRQGVEESHRIRGMQLSWKDAKYADISLDLNSIILENEIRMAQDIEWLKDMWETAHDAGLLEVRYWAAIGDPNITYDVNDMLFVGDILYATNYTDNSLLIYNTDGGGWTRVLVPFKPLRLANVGNDVYIGASGGRIYKYSSGTLTEIAVAIYSTEPTAVTFQKIISIGNDLYFSGTFDEIDSVSINGVAKYNTVGETWSDLGGGGLAGVMATDGTNIYASFSGTIKRWNGSWTTLGSAFTSPVFALAVYGTDLLAGSSQTGGIFIWNGSSWSVFEGGVDGGVYAITTLLTDVYAGGSFTDKGSKISKFSGGSWWELEEGTNNSVLHLAMHNEDLYVSGSFTRAGDKSAQGIAAYFTNFESLADYLEDSSSGFNLGEAIHNATAKTSLTGADEFPLWDSLTSALRKITWTNIIASIKSWADTIYVALTGNQTIAGIKTFSSFPVLPSADPTSDYQAATKKYVDDNAGGGGGTPAGADRQVQFNAAGAFGADDQFIYQSDLRALGIGDYDSMPFDTTRMMWLVGDDESPSHFGVAYGSARAAFAGFAKADGDAASPTNVKNNQVIGRVRGYGYDGSEWSGVQAEIRIVADGDWGTGDKPTRIEIYTTPDGSGTLTLVATIRSDGHVNIASGKEYRVNGAQHQHSASDIASGMLDAARLPKAETFTVKNTSGAIANNYDAGYISASGEYKTSTTSRDVVDWCVVVSGGANNADIIVARRGRVTVNYTGTAPSAGHYLSLSTSAGLAQRETEMHPAIFAVCTAAGSGGTVEVQLLCLTVFRPLTKSTDILRINAMSNSDFVATINGTPSGANVTYNAPSSGNENTIAPVSSSEVGNLVCFNTTRGNYALIDSVNTGTNVITLTASAPANWASGDTITLRSQAYSSAFNGSSYLYEIDLTGCSLSKTRAISLSCQAHDTGTITGNVFAFIHKYSTSPAFASGISWIADWSHIVLPSVELVSNRIMFCIGASGSGTMNYFIVRLNGVWEAVP